jgi:hypothetical protein
VFAKPMPKTQLIGILRRRLGGHFSRVHQLASVR